MVGDEAEAVADTDDDEAPPKKDLGDEAVGPAPNEALSDCADACESAAADTRRSSRCAVDVASASASSHFSYLSGRWDQERDREGDEEMKYNREK